MGWLETKYALMLSSRLRNFKQKSGALLEFSCPFCGDSQSNKRRARGYLYEKDGDVYFYCHNACGGMSFTNFLNRMDIQLCTEYKLDRLKEEGRPAPNYKEFVTKPTFDVHKATKDFEKLPTISSLPWNHQAKIYIQDRKIPNYWHSQIRWAKQFQTWVNEYMLPGKYEDVTMDEGRLVIPFMNEKNKVFAYLGRAISDNSVRYMLNVLEHSEPLIWGRNYVKLNKRKYKVPVTEGPIDAMFLYGMAMNGGNFAPLLDLADREKFVLVYDNEPRSKDTCKKMLHAIENNFPICVWPDNIDHKDINKMILQGYTIEHIWSTIEKNTFQGTVAKFKLQNWSKVGLT